MALIRSLSPRAANGPITTGRAADQTRLPGLDIMRALAILLVMFSHWVNNIGVWTGWRAPRELFELGEIGVNLFFALSGFLIGRILLEVVAAPAPWPALGRFMMRRWMRTLPLYWLWLAVLLTRFPPRTGRLDDALHFATMTQNLWRPMPADFFFAVSWTLSVEEWFYLLFGLLAVAWSRFPGGRRLTGPLAVFLILPLAPRLLVPGFEDAATGFATMVPFRLDAIAYGVVVARLVHDRGRVPPYPLLAMAAGLTLIGIAWLDHALLPPAHVLAVWTTCFPLGAALCLPAALSVRAGGGIAMRIIRWISLRSYALYLVHVTILVDLAQPLLFLHRIGPGTAIAIALLLPFVTAELLGRLVEQPIMRARPPQWPAAAPQAARNNRSTASP
jgi:peptidoglycan/LPS O-acetylase OafA/YrhL